MKSLLKPCKIPTDATELITKKHYPHLHVAMCCVLTCMSPLNPQGVNDVLQRGPDTVTVTDDLT